eukprot:TRINITY_DN102538_c0_g1_i1.p1 TRINITY_DN102538_c0_g1~~TRINITY_DN102538_c0_g1_i1.p1  ORF type:complete len:558 (-),score=88.40 TRINITY_DN102538_c0_g1_i1:5-1594(-)
MGIVVSQCPRRQDPLQHDAKFRKIVRKASGRLGQVATVIRYHRGKQVTDDYDLQVTQVLGNGYNGPVYTATDKDTGTSRAVKEIKLGGISESTLEDLASECEVFLCMDHPHVARLVDVFQETDRLTFVMECLHGGELFDRILQKKRFAEPDAADTAYQMLLAVNYLHEHRVVHRDIKLENFMYESPTTDHLKLIDFGFSKILDTCSNMHTRCGTLEYMAPEVLAKNYTDKCDIWSLGVVSFILLTGYMPFGGDRTSMMQNIQAGSFVQQDSWHRLSDEACDFVLSMMKVNTMERHSAADALGHDFIKQRSEMSKHTQVTAADDRTLGSLYELAAASKVRRASLTAMAWSLTSDDCKELREDFLAMDTDNSGTISLSEFREAIGNKYEIKGEQIEQAFANLDAAGNHEIHYTEFLAAMVSTRINLHEGLLRSTFRRFDKDGSGFIELDELKQVLGDGFVDKDIRELMEQADDNDDGKISYAEFIEFAKTGHGVHADATGAIIDTALSQQPKSGQWGALAQVSLLKRPIAE